MRMCAHITLIIVKERNKMIHRYMKLMDSQIVEKTLIIVVTKSQTVAFKRLCANYHQYITINSLCVLKALKLIFSVSLLVATHAETYMYTF